MSGNFNSWGKSDRPRGRSRVNWESQPRRQFNVPRGLRGREIGMYFRDQQQSKKKKWDLTINLKIPEFVLSALDNNLKAITKFAAQNNIAIPKLTEIEFIKNNTDKGDEKPANDGDKTIKKEYENDKFCEAGPSGVDFVPVKNEHDEHMSEPRLLPLRKSHYKYGYEDIISGTFEEKLDECIAKGISINSVNTDMQNLNTALLMKYQDMLQNSGYKSMLKFRETLPTYKKSKELLDIINNNQVVVISGETGCGKSTQVPQIILDEAICNNRGANVKILVTQPRRIAASSLAMRVANERGEKLGNSIGYAVRLEKVEERTYGSIQYCTTGILLADLEVDQGLTKFSHVILDEVHERDIHVDLSMCMLKQVLKKRKDLKLILMSATLDADTLSSYFDNCPLMHIEGLAYPVEDIFLEDILSITKYNLPPEKTKRDQPKWMKYRNKTTANEMEKEIKYRKEISPWLESVKSKISHDVYKTLQECRIEDLNLELIEELLIYICKGQPGAILVFLPGIADITKLMRLMGETNNFPSNRFEIYPLHSKLPTLEQHKIFERPGDGIRKIIIATNIAETSITIDDIVYVVDCGKIKMSGLNVEKNHATLVTDWVSKANLRQRRGRAGRCQPGICYHLLTSYRAEVIPERLLPELQRSNLLEPVLMIKRLRLGYAADAFKLVPSAPAESTVQWAVNHLQKCGALDSNETLTPLGWHLARLPVHPAAGKLLILGALFGCIDRAASVAAVWGFKDPFMLVIGKEREVDKAKSNFALGEPSDHIAISEAISQWESCPHRDKRSFAYENFISNNTMSLLIDMKKQLADNLRQMGFLTTGNLKSSWENRNEDNLSLFKAVVAASLYPNIAHVKLFSVSILTYADVLRLHYTSKGALEDVIPACEHGWKNLHNRRKMPSFTARNIEDGRLTVHPSSVMTTASKMRSRGVGVELCKNPGANWLVYWLKQRSTDLFIFEVTLIYSLPLLFFGEFVVSDDLESPETCLLSISEIKVRCKRDTAFKLFQLRALLDQVLAANVTTETNSLQNNEFDDLVLKTVTQIITAEDEQAEYVDDFHDSDTSEG